MNWRIGERGFKAGLVTAAALCVVALISGVGARLLGASAVDRTRLLVVDMGGFSWGSVLDARVETNMPYIRGILAGNGAYGDVLTKGYASDSEILASLLTGRFPVNHGLTNAPTAGPMDGDRDPARRLVWDQIHRAGQPVAVVGFPLWYPLHGNDSLVSPSPRSFAGAGVVYHDGISLRDPSYTSLVVPADRIPDALQKRIRGDVTLPDAVQGAINACLADDLTITAMAEQAVRTVPRAHLFVYLSGLSVLDAALRSLDGSVVSESTREMLLCRYHVFVDGLLARLDAAMNDSPKTVFIVSENHTAKGFFAAIGRNIRRTENPQIVQPADVAVTLLYLAGAPLPITMDGVILHGILNDEFFFKHPYRTAP